MNSKRFIVVAGNIGSGKTTLTGLLAERYSWQPHFEVVAENPYLPDFYSNMLRWSLQLQVYFLSKRFKAHQDITRGNKSAIQDRSIYEDAHIFAKALRETGNMDERDYANYYELYLTMTEQLTPPDLIIYVKRSMQCLRSRISIRGRKYEEALSEKYLLHLNNCYEEWISNYKLGKVLTIDADDLDIKCTPSHFEYVCRSIESSLEQPELFFRC